jgi:hemoglobin
MEVGVERAMAIEFGVGDGSFRTAGGEVAIRRLVDDFYDIMDVEAQFQTIRRMHPKDLDESRDKLARFLCGWLGGPKRYHEKYGSISIPKAHAHFVVGKAEREAWLDCMEKAIARQSYPSQFAEYLLKELRVPAQGIYKKSRKPPGETYEA